MRKLSKMLILVLVIALTVCCVFALTACIDNNPDNGGNVNDNGNNNGDNNGNDNGGNGDNGNNDGNDDVVEPSVGYKFTVLDENGNGVKGAKVQLCVPGEGGMCFIPVETDENGVAFFEETEDFTAQVLEIHLQEYASTGRVKINGADSKYTFDNTAMKTEATFGEYTLQLVVAE